MIGSPDPADVATSTDNHLLTGAAGSVLTLTLNRPESLNSLTTALLDDLQAALRAAESDASVRAIVIAGAGRAFSSGASLTPSEGGFDAEHLVKRHYNPLIETLRRVEKPIVASLNGIAAGAAAGLALACDFRIMSREARIAFLFVRIGLVPDAGSSYFLPRLVGRSRATELLMLGDDVTADAALSMGLVHRVVPPEDLAAETEALAQRLAAAPRAAGMVKRQLLAAEDLSLSEQLALEAEIQGEAALTADFAEGVAAFREKRAPKFSGR